MSARSRARNAEAELKEISELAEKSTDRLENVQSWIKDMLVEHHPEVSGRVDLSISSNSELRSEFLKGLGKNLYCRTCRNPWPCKTLQNIRALKDITWGRGYIGLPCKSEKPSGTELYL